MLETCILAKCAILSEILDLERVQITDVMTFVGVTGNGTICTKNYKNQTIIVKIILVVE